MTKGEGRRDRVKARSDGPRKSVTKRQRVMKITSAHESYKQKGKGVKTRNKWHVSMADRHDTVRAKSSQTHSVTLGESPNEIENEKEAMFSFVLFLSSLNALCVPSVSFHFPFTFISGACTASIFHPWAKIIG